MAPPPGAPQIVPSSEARIAWNERMGERLAAGEKYKHQHHVDRIIELLDGSTCDSDEAEIIEILSSVDARGLNYILLHLYANDRIADLFADVDEGFWPWQDNHRTALLKLVSQERVADLDTRTRQAVIYGLMKGKTEAQEEIAIRDILKATEGEQLTRLKNLIDARSPDDLAKLVYHDIDDKVIRNEILAHFARQSFVPEDVLVLSDIDDTVVRNWMDPRFPSKAVYPGVRIFYQRLGNISYDHLDRQGPTFLSARPGERTGTVEREFSVKSLKGYGFDFPTVLTGDVLHLHSDEAIAAKKYENFASYRQLYPEYRMVFIGDSGQGDEIAGRKMLADKEAKMAAVFIHDVAERHHNKRNGYVVVDGIVYFDTYIGAALAAYVQHHWISPSSVSEVARQARYELGFIKFNFEAQRAAAEALLNRDRDLVRARGIAVD